MSAVLRPTAVAILADLKRDLYASAAFQHAAYDDADFADRRYLDGVNSAYPDNHRTIASPRMKDDFFSACLDSMADKFDLDLTKAADAETASIELRREFLP